MADELKVLDEHISLSDFGLSSKEIKTFVKVFTKTNEDGTVKVLPNLAFEWLENNNRFAPHIFK